MPFLDKNKVILDITLSALSFVVGTEFSGDATLVLLEPTKLRGLILSYSVEHGVRGEDELEKYGLEKAAAVLGSRIFIQEAPLFGGRKESAKEVAAGTHTFPFRVSIPEWLPATMTTAQGKVRHQVKLEALIPYSVFSNKSERFDLHVIRGVAPLEYQQQEAKSQSQLGVKGSQCSSIPCCSPCRTYDGTSSLTLEAVNDWQLTVYKPIVSLLNDRTIPVRVQGRITSRCQVALVREVFAHMALRSRRIVGQFLLPRTPPHISNPVMNIHIPLDFESIEDCASCSPRVVGERCPEWLVEVKYYMTVYVLYDEGCCPGIPTKLVKRVPVTVVHCIHESAPSLPPVREEGLTHQGSALSNSHVVPTSNSRNRGGEEEGIEMNTMTPPRPMGPMGAGSQAGVSSARRDEGDHFSYGPHAIATPLTSSSNRGGRGGAQQQHSAADWEDGSSSMASRIPASTTSTEVASRFQRTPFHFPTWMQDVDLVQDSHINNQHHLRQQVQHSQSSDPSAVAEAPKHSQAPPAAYSPVNDDSVHHHHNTISTTTTTTGGGGGFRSSSTMIQASSRPSSKLPAPMPNPPRSGGITEVNREDQHVEFRQVEEHEVPSEQPSSFVIVDREQSVANEREEPPGTTTSTSTKPPVGGFDRSEEPREEEEIL